MNIGWEGVGSQGWESFLITEARVIPPKNSNFSPACPDLWSLSLPYRRPVACASLPATSAHSYQLPAHSSAKLILALELSLGGGKMRKSDLPGKPFLMPSSNLGDWYEEEDSSFLSSQQRNRKLWELSKHNMKAVIFHFNTHIQSSSAEQGLW